jgi:hypothetical protein
MPSSSVPLAYYAVGYMGFGAGLMVLGVDPSLPGSSFYQPRFIALVHLLTLAWLTGSILGSLYIVGPLALRTPMRVARSDWFAFGSFVFGTSGMIAHFWINTYDGMAWSAVFVLAAIGWVGVRLTTSLHESVAWGVRLHVMLAFLNILGAAVFGMIIGFDRGRGFLSVSPLAMMFAHAHIAAVGWVTMLVTGLSYRLIPMMLPASMPSGRSLGSSAVLIECGLLTLTLSLLAGSKALPLGALVIAGGIAAFVINVRGMLRRRLPRPPALPQRDWSTWQIHTALTWLLIAMVSGVSLSIGVDESERLPLMWIYGSAGLLGFMAQMVVGMQGRLVPMYAWYRAYDAVAAPPATSAHALSSPALARIVFVAWLCGAPLLCVGLAQGAEFLIRTGAIALLIGLFAAAANIIRMLQCARRLPLAQAA